MIKSWAWKIKCLEQLSFGEKSQQTELHNGINKYFLEKAITKTEKTDVIHYQIKRSAHEKILLKTKNWRSTDYGENIHKTYIWQRACMQNKESN